MRPSGDANARLAESYALRRPELVRFAYFLAGDWSTAEDVVHDAFVRIFAKHRRIDDAGFSAYARQTIVRLLSSTRRRRALERQATPAVPEAVYDQLPDPRLWHALSVLSAQQRACVVLRFHDDLPEAAIAEILGVSRGAVHKQLTRALDKLRSEVPYVQDSNRA